MTKSEIERWPASAPGRSRIVAVGDLVWLVANSQKPAEENFEQQTATTLSRLEKSLAEAGSSKERLISVQIFMTDIRAKPIFDAAWDKWIGPDPAHWPQRICVQAGLVPGLLLEIQAVAMR